MNFLAVSLSNVEVDSSLDDIITKVRVREENDHLHNGVLVLLFFSLEYILINLIVDLLYGVLNPKVRYE